MKQIIESIDFNRNRSEYWRELIEKVMPGNILEIGAGYGESTVLFCEIAKKYRRKVLVIDPFEDGWELMPKSYQYGYAKFLSNMKGFSNWTVFPKSSQDESCASEIAKFTPISFAFIDGLQSKEAVLSDLKLVEQFKPSIICVDDANRLTGDSRVPEALAEYQGEYKLIYQCREAYLCL